MYTIFHKLTRSSAIALAVLSISGTAVAESIPGDTRAGNRQTPAKVIHVSGPSPRTRVPEVSVAAPTVPLARAARTKSIRDPAEPLVLGIPGSGKVDNHLKAGADDNRVVNTPGNRNYDNIFNRANTPATVNWVVAQKCGWICVVRKF